MEEEKSNWDLNSTYYKYVGYMEELGKTFSRLNAHILVIYSYINNFNCAGDYESM